MYNLADACEFKDSNERMIRDLLIVGCNSDKAFDKIVQKGEKITLNEVIEFSHIENQSLQEIISTTQKGHYASYDKKKSKGKKKELIAYSTTNPIFF